MDHETRQRILSLAREAHDLTEQSYLQNPAVSSDPEWGGKQRVLLADMALHLLQTALKEGELCEEGLRLNLFSILTISDHFLTGYDSKAVADELYAA
jgi:hypothetical protein